MHLAIYRERPDVEAIVHTHPPTTIGIVSAGHDEIPYLFPDHVALVGKLPCIGYVIPCTPELAAAVVEAMGAAGINGLLMRNHGLITVGATVREAYYRTEVVEDAARVFWIALTSWGAFSMRGLIVGDPTAASPLVFEDSPYNVSHARIQEKFGGVEPLIIVAEGKDQRTGDALVTVQWLRFGGGGGTQMVGIARKDQWDAVFPRMRAVRDGWAPK